MKMRALFGLSVLSGFLAWGLIAGLYAWPELKTAPLKVALMALIAPHMFRFVGLSFLVPGVVSEKLPAEFAGPAAWGDLIAAFLAMAAMLGVANDAPWALVAVWIFNVFGTIDLLNAMYQGPRKLDAVGPGVLGAAFYIPTLLVPGLLASHALIFQALLGAA